MVLDCHKGTFNLNPGDYELYDNSDFFLDEFSVENGQVELLIMPVYHRLDIAASYKFGETDKTAHRLKLSLINIYDRRNIVYPRVYQDEINQIRFSEGLPFIPSIAYHFSLN